MYPSDYMYAGDPRACTIISSEYPSSDCNHTNWIELDVGGGYRWFITPLAMSPDSSFMLDNGAISSNIVSYSGINTVYTHPVVYLKPEITSSGSGTYDNPYEFYLID